MAIQWSGYDNHFRVGIDYSISPSSPSHSDTSVKVTWKYYVDTADNWSISSDNETAHCSPGGNHGYTYSGHSAKLVAQSTNTYGISYNSGTASASLTISGVYNGATPSVSRTVNLPNRPITTPSNGEGPTASNIGTTSATISWNAPDDNGGDGVDEYELQVDNSSGFGSPAYQHTFSETGAASDTATGLSPNTHYYARVRAHNSAGWGDWTSNTYCQFTTEGALPSVPPGFVEGSHGTDYVLMTWRASNSNGGGSITYTCECDTTSSFSSPTIETTTGNGYTFSGLSEGTTYYFRVKATNSYGSSDWSSTVSQATKSTPTYTDNGTMVDHVNHLASAVADKFCHLGNSLTRCKADTTVSLPENTTTYLHMGNFVEQHGLDCPTYVGGSGTGTHDFQINYPGTYQIEFAINVDMTTATTSSGYIGQMIYVNGQDHITTTLQKAGLYIRHPAPNGAGSSAMFTMTINRYLEAGDYVGWAIYMNANNGTSSTSTGDNGGGISCYASVTMVGF